ALHCPGVGGEVPGLAPKHVSVPVHASPSLQSALVKHDLPQPVLVHCSPPVQRELSKNTLHESVGSSHTSWVQGTASVGGHDTAAPGMHPAAFAPGADGLQTSAPLQ